MIENFNRVPAADIYRCRIFCKKDGAHIAGTVRKGKGDSGIYMNHFCRIAGRMRIAQSADQGSVTQQFAEFDAEEAGDIRKEIFLRLREAVLPVGDGSAHQIEQFITACPGHSFPFSQDPEFGSETHGITAFLSG
jgi:hypothetical protein